MGISIDRPRRIAGYRPAVFKNALAGYERTRSPGNFIDFKTLFAHRRDGAIVYEECLDRGLIDPETGKLTDAGLGLATAKVVARTPWPKARAILDVFLDRVDRLNADPAAIKQVDEIWLYGSFLREEATVGDLDMAIESWRTEPFENLDAAVVQAKEQIKAFPDAPQTWTFPWDRIEWLYRRALFGARRHPLLAGAKEGTSDLAPLGVPCKLIYDRSRGGRVDDPILPRHPQSTGRSNTIEPPREMPNLSPAELRPMDARWVAGYQPWGSVSPYCIFRGWTDACKQLFPHYPGELRIVADGHDLRDYPWVPRSLMKSGLDGRAAVAIMSATQLWGTCVTLHRSIEAVDVGMTLHARFSDVLMHRARTRFDLSSLWEMSAAVSLILAVDAERLLRRMLEEGSPAKVSIIIHTGMLPEEMQMYFAEDIAERLTKRDVAIEPAASETQVEVHLVT